MASWRPEATCASRHRCCSRKWRWGGLPPRSKAVYPEVQIEVVSEDRLANLIDEHFDVAIRINPRKDSALVGRCFARDRLVLVASLSVPMPKGRREKHGLEDLSSPALDLDVIGQRQVANPLPRGGEQRVGQRRRERGDARLTDTAQWRADIDDAHLH